MTKKQNYSFARLEDNTAVAIFMIVAFGAGIASLFRSSFDALKRKVAQYKTKQR